jgi:hypothetical protein
VRLRCEVFARLFFQPLARRLELCGIFIVVVVSRVTLVVPAVRHRHVRIALPIAHLFFIPVFSQNTDFS